MARYTVWFLKNVLGDNGRQAEICQSLLEIEAPSSSLAAELAKNQFCQMERLCDWSLHADRLRVAEAELPA